MNSVRWNNLSLKYQILKQSGSKEILQIWKKNTEFIHTQFSGKQYTENNLILVVFVILE